MKLQEFISQVIGSDNELEGILGEEELINEVFDDEMPNEDETNQSLGSPLTPERVLVFTTLNLLSMLSICAMCHVDGTFKVCC